MFLTLVRPDRARDGTVTASSYVRGTPCPLLCHNAFKRIQRRQRRGRKPADKSECLTGRYFETSEMPVGGVSASVDWSYKRSLLCSEFTLVWTTLQLCETNCRELVQMTQGAKHTHTHTRANEAQADDLQFVRSLIW